MSNNTYLDNDADTDTDSEDESFIYHDDGLNILGQENENHDILNEAFIQEDGDGGVMTIDELQVDQGPLTIEDLNTDHVDPDEPETDDELDISFGGKKKTATKKKSAKKKTATKKKSAKKKTATKRKSQPKRRQLLRKSQPKRKRLTKKKTATKKKTTKKKTATKKKTTKKKTATKKKKTSTKKKGLLGIFMGGKNKKKQPTIYSSYATINLIF